MSGARFHKYLCANYKMDASGLTKAKKKTWKMVNRITYAKVQL